MPKQPPVRIKEFNDYVLWRNIPSMLRGMQEEDLRKKFGIEDEVMIELCQFRTQKEFAKQYKQPLSHDTLWEWNKLIDDEKLDRIGQNKWLSKLTANVKLALYGTAMKTGRAPEVGLFLEVSGDYIPKSEVINNNSGENQEESLDEIEQAIVKKQNQAAEIKKRMAAIGKRSGSNRTRIKGTAGKTRSKGKAGASKESEETDL